MIFDSDGSYQVLIFSCAAKRMWNSLFLRITCETILEQT